ncbi:isochorismate lyase [Affinibrenneria salicis]|uniref:chorismate mutase n=1 Tax=Affinibrenneria salicis TaxID=2590031 RepID=A0A5J5FR62_9GAMM|nr:isochorismate lyase [Affinibrenneria salicis]KAA8995603.1 isochorismate lyase [Affinibrenneria salicis]
MTSQQSIAPSQCANMEAIRNEIDAIDRQVIRLLARRFDYVKAAAPFKKNPDEVQARERFTSMLAQRRDWATDYGLDAEMIEKLYRDLVGWFIAQEMAHWSGQNAERA